MRNKVLCKIMFSLLCLIFLLASFGGCENKPNSDDDGGKTKEEVTLSFNEKNVEVAAGEEVQLTVSASDGSSPSLIWSSNNDLVAEVNESGLVRGISEGNAVIKAVTDAGASVLCNVTVTSNETKSLLSVSLNRSSVSLYTGDSVTAKAVVKYGSTIIQSVTPTWKSGNPDVASVNESGVITGVAAGETEITAKAEYKNVSDEAKIKVTIYSEGVLISPDFASETIIAGDNVELAVSVMKNCERLTEYAVTYTSSEEDVATISGTTLSAKKAGDTDITVNCVVDGENYSFTQKIRVYGKYFVDFYSENILIKAKEYKYGEVVPIEYTASTLRSLKYYTLNGVKIDGDKFIMPDEPVRVDAKYINDTDDDFTNDFSTGTIFFSQAEVEFVKNDLIAAGESVKKAYGNGAVKLTGSWASKQFNFEKEVTIGKSSVMRMRLYRPASVALIYLGNEKDKTDPPVQIGNKGDLVAEGHYTVELSADCWEYVEVPLTAFGEVGTKLSAVSIACSGDYIYIDEISVTEIDLTDNFTGRFTDGTIFVAQGEVEFITSNLPVDASCNKANGNGAVKLTGSWASKQFNFEKEVTIGGSSVMRMRLYRPASVALIYIGNNTSEPPVQIGNKGDLVAEGHYTVELSADCWEYVDVPLTAFGEVGTQLSAVSIACSSDYIYIDEISIVNAD